MYQCVCVWDEGCADRAHTAHSTQHTGHQWLPIILILILTLYLFTCLASPHVPHQSQVATGTKKKDTMLRSCVMIWKYNGLNIILVIRESVGRDMVVMDGKEVDGGGR